jgi:pyridoxal phosphate enzyme (YggS family)
MDRQDDEIPEPGGVEALREARDRVLQRIDAACRRVGRDPSEVELVAISKTVPVERLLLAAEAGFEVLGENRVQEAASKIPLVGGPRWHLVGHLQANKAKAAVELFDVIESVDSIDLARRLSRLAGEVGESRPEPYPVLLQVNVDEDVAKAGFTTAGVAQELSELAELPNLRLDGLMTVGRLVRSAEEARPTFVALRRLSERLRPAVPALGAALSMGMSDDFDVACEEGATLVRVGRALFGARPPATGD